MHRKLNGPLLRKLVTYAQDGNPLNTHSDVPEGLQEEIRLEDQQDMIARGRREQRPLKVFLPLTSLT